jgi:hypothetical protein
MATPPPNEAAKLAILRQQLMDKIKQDQQYKQTTDRQYTSAIQPNPNWTPTKAKGGVMSQDAMQLAVMNKPKHFAQGGSEPRNWSPGNDKRLQSALRQVMFREPALVKGVDTAGEMLEHIKKTTGPEHMDEQLAQEMQRLEKRHAINQWLERNFGNYVKKQMATENDPVRLQAETGVQGFPVAADPSYWARKGETRRKTSGGKQIGQSDVAKHWENKTDAMIEAEKAQEHQDMMHLAPGMYSEKDEWIKKLDPNANLWSLTEHFDPRDLGMDHIRDVLHEDLVSGRIRPEQLNKISMAQAVKRAHEYDQEIKKRRQETAIQTTNEMPTVHEYPESGMKWIELAKPDGDKFEESIRHLESDPKEWQKAVEDFRQNSSKKLEDALKYEGDTMGHCVGGKGYCEKVKRGEARIFSLRDAKGEPHVTIETSPEEQYKEAADILGIDDPTSEDVRSLRESGRLPKAQERIVQIKGKGNRKPAAKYIPHVQHFVKSGDWSHIGDYENTDLIQVKKGKHATKEEVEALGRHHYPEHNMLAENVLMHYDRMRGMPEMQNEATKNFIADMEAGNYRMPAPVIKKAQGGNVQLSIEQMRQQLMSAGKGLPDMSQIGAQEAPNMPVKNFVIPQNGAQGSMPMGGVDMSPMQPGQQMLPSNALQPNPLMPQQPDQQQGGAPMGGAPLGGMPPPPAGGSNILQMTPQGQAMAAMKPPMQKADGGMVGLPMTFKVGGSDNMPMNNDYSDNGATDFNIDNIQQLAGGGQPKKQSVAEMKEAIFQKAQQGLMKPSEVLGRHEGKYMHITEADRAKVEKRKHGMRGGVGFSQIGLEDPEYAGMSWGVGKPGTGIKLINRQKRGLKPDEQSIYTTFIGTPEMHTSNQLVFNRMYNKFMEARKSGLLSPEQEAKMLDILRSLMTKGTKKNPSKPIFDKDISFDSPHQAFNTFDRRRALSNLMAGVGIGGKKGQIFDASKMIEDTTDPRLLHAPTLSVGPHVFSLSGEMSNRPDLNKAFPIMLHGESYPEAFQQLPFKEAAPDFTEQIRKSKGRDPGYMDIVRGIPRQQLTEKYLTGLQKIGKKKGGKVSDNLDTMRLSLTRNKKAK